MNWVGFLLFLYPMTAQEFDRIFQERIDKAYNDYVSPPQRERIYKQAMYNAFEVLYNSPVDQEWTDELRSFIKINEEYTPINGVVSIDTQIPDYNHYLFSRVRYITPVNQPFVSFHYSGTGTIRGHVKVPSVYRTGTLVTLSGSSMAEANGTFYLKQIGRLIYELYQDAALTTPVTATQFDGTGASVSVTTISSAVVIYSDERISRLDLPTERNPRVIIAENSINIEPANADKLILDYLTNPPVFITQTNGVFDNTFDLETVYPAKFLYQIIGKAEEIFNVQAKDTQSFRDGVNLENLNP